MTVLAVSMLGNHTYREAAQLMDMEPEVAGAALPLAERRRASHRLSDRVAST